MRVRADNSDTRIGRIERLSKIDLDILDQMRPFMPSLAPPEGKSAIDAVMEIEQSDQEYVRKLAESPFMQEPVDAPPSHPLPVDRGRFRIAEEPPGTDLHQSWVLDWCVECREPTWTHNHIVADKHETICESCYYVLVSDYWDRQGKQLRMATMRVVNPFE